jgi:cell wall-associated NlpC family hydrolase
LSELSSFTSTRVERGFERRLLRLVGMPYVFGGRGYGGVDCSSLIVRAVRDALGLRVAQLPWMTADQLGRGRLGFTRPADEAELTGSPILVFFDWDEDEIFEHVAVKLGDGSWIWSSSSAGRVVHVNPVKEKVLRRQWREIEGALDGSRSSLRLVDWQALRGLR